MSDPVDADTAESPPVAPRSGLARIWERFHRARGARLGLYLVVLFSLVALLAPFLAHRLPLYWFDLSARTMSFPLIREFFAPSDTTEPMLERGINFLFLFLPLAWLAWKAMGRFFPALGKKESRAISLLFGILVAAALWAAIGGMVVDGGGKDWLHREQAPVPELDDIADPGAARLAPSPTEPALLAVRGIDIDAAASPDDQRRRIIGAVQDAIEGPALSADGLPAFDRLDLDPNVLDTPIDRARWNRLAIEAAFPGLLTPMRQFRGTFLAMVAVSLVALAGLSYICLAGAWQFSLSPRWLVLLILGVLLAQLFRLPIRHDHTPYRRLHAEKKGVGIFPVIPYGPNEQGFGPRQPPTWWAESPRFAAESVMWPDFESAVAEPPSPAASRVAELLRENGAPPPSPAASPAERAKTVAALNALVASDTLYDGEAFADIRVDANLQPYLSIAKRGGDMTAPQRERFNRLLIEKALPRSFKPVAASRWKRPTHTPGYHLLGTDESGRDVLVRIIHGARVSLSVGFVSVFLATVIGLVLGSLAAYYGGKIDMAISRFMEIMMCFPSFFLILAVIAVLDRRSIVNIMLVIGLTSWTGVARLIRGEMLRQKKMDYVSASVALGASDTRTIFRHILPNAMAPVLVSISFGITGAILTEASLSFIGFGVTPPTPTWGQLLSETRESPLANWWLAVFPGAVLFISVLAYNFVGEALRDALDPRTTL